MKRSILLLVSFFSYQLALAQEVTVDQSETDVPVDYSVRTFNESDFQNYRWLREFKNVIVINKANTGTDKQTLRLYVDGKMKEFTRVSSGRENFEKGCSPGQEPKKDHCSLRSYWSTTPNGYFDVQKLDKNYYSNLWQTWMPYSVFFDSGIATHQAPPGTEVKLGNRASGGCVRLHPSMAPVIFDYVERAGVGLVPKVLRNGDVAKTAQGDVIRTQGYRTLVIVQNVIR